MTATVETRPPIERTEHPHVVKRAGVLGGQPIVDGQRIAVRHLLDLYESGMSVDEILKTFPTLKPAHVHDALSYAYDHPDEMAAVAERRRLRNVLRAGDLVYVDGRLIPRAALDRVEVPSGVPVYTWETLPDELDSGS